MGQTILSLLAFMEEADAYDYIGQACALTPEQQRQERLTATWKAARKRRGDPIPGAGYPDIRPIPDAYHAYLERVMAHPRFMNPVDGMDVDFALVEIEPLLAYQQHIWLEHAQARCAHLPRNPSFDDVLTLCLPERIEPIGANVEVRRGPYPGHTIIAVTDLDIDTLPLTIHPAADPTAHVIGWQQQRKLPYVQVARFNGRCYLRNGFHRVYGLVERGVTHVPCIFLKATTVEQAGIRPGHTLGLDVLESDDPPTVAHFTRGRVMPLPMQRYEMLIGVEGPRLARCP